MTNLDRQRHGPAAERPLCGSGPDVPDTATCRQFERLRFWNGRLLTAHDLRDQQGDLIRRVEEHQRHAHGYGVVFGLAVEQHPRVDCRDRYVVVQPGIAYDCCGRALVVCEPTVVDITRLDRYPEGRPVDRDDPAERDDDDGGEDDERGEPRRDRRGGRDDDGDEFEPEEVGFVVIRRHDRPTNPAPALLSDDLSDPIRTEHGRIQEAVQFVAVPPEEIDELCWPRRRPLADCAGRDLDDRRETRSLPGFGDCPCRDGLPIAQLVRHRGELEIETWGRPLVATLAELTRVTGLSWEHGAPMRLEDLQVDPDDDSVRELVIRLSKPLRRDDRHPGGVDPNVFTVSYRTANGQPVLMVSDPGDPGAPGPRLSPDGLCLVYRLPPQLVLGRINIENTTVLVTLRCDFLVDEDGFVVSGSHLGGIVPNRGVAEGGLFESWFQVVG